ncbi:MAG: hypothetical protein GWN01_15980 [Nitrosopumilaceae archaeon]|nr:HAMP domain-containing histidine kinase [Nitrosopumilaceae archaeon]NIU02336.1 HAMP domain-containing histidine kinase [Nitrosopumilaceae archaeon]NIU88791.1 hypothetical protein [Nitrosopumilaceae archaeon]NIV66918.1 hypothetical protein [Nitrosopumilaceae archaeon]NIX62937.1 hypothetical protein [Nitrosopumilaceae archaeon]
MKINRIKITYTLYALIGVFILVSTVTGSIEYESIKDESISQQKEETRRITNEILSEKKIELKTIANAIEAFYAGSEKVTQEDFEEFAQKVTADNNKIKAIFTLKDDAIVHSYPDASEVGRNFYDLFPTVPVNYKGTNFLDVKFERLDNDQTVLIVPLDYFIDISKRTLSDNYKLSLSLSDGKTIFELKNTDGAISRTVDFTKDELSNAVITSIDTGLSSKVLDSDYEFTYRIWDSRFVPELSTIIQVLILVASIAVGITIPVLLIRAKKFSVKLEKQDQELQEANIAKDEFSAMVTHELKTPLVPIIGYTKMLTKEEMLGKLNKQQIDAVKIISKNAKHLEQLITDILDSRKLEMGKMKFSFNEISVSSLLNDIKEDYEKVLEENKIKLQINSKVDSISIKTDENRLRQVFDNLINNASKFVKEGQGIIEVGAEKQNSDVLFYVKDNGIGIPEEERKKLFQKFYQIDTAERRKHQGTGLGLVISKGIIEQLGGKIWFESEDGKGTAFYFKFPLESKPS